MSGCDQASTAGQPGRDDLTTRIFRALYHDYDLLIIGATHIVTPKGTPVFTGHSLAQIARQISDRDCPAPAAPGTPPGDLPRR